MTAVKRYRILTVLCAGLGGGLFAGLGSIHDLFWRIVVGGAGMALFGATLLFYGEAARAAK